MYKGKKILALIPARGGSKGLPGKNVRPFLGKPLIAWTIGQAKKARYVDKVIVSTDDKETAEISERYGAEVPFMRPRKIARDGSYMFETVLHAIHFFEKEKKPYDILLLLQCTNPIRYQSDIDNMIRLLGDNQKANVVQGVIEAARYHPFLGFKLANGYLALVNASANNLNRQDLAKVYLACGIYITRWDKYKKYKTFNQPHTLPYFLKKEQAIDIDDELDFYLAKSVFRKYLLK